MLKSVRIVGTSLHTQPADWRVTSPVINFLQILLLASIVILPKLGHLNEQFLEETLVYCYESQVIMLTQAKDMLFTSQYKLSE